MKKGQFKSQANSGRAAGGFGAFGSYGFGSTPSSVLSYVQEPADYSTISDASTVVAFKSLSKKDSTTKAKALEDLLASLAQTSDGIEDAIVEAWVKQYPRLSTDNARRVRQLSHQLTGQIAAKCGKRIAKQLPKIAGPWLAGTFDVDRSVSKTAQDALNSVFPSSDKINNLRKTFQGSIIHYSRDAVLNETVGTLSDERSVSADDAKAAYARVISTSLAVVSSLIGNLCKEELAKHKHDYEAVLGDKKFWQFSHYEDPGVRKATHRLVQTCLGRDSGLVEPHLTFVSNAYVYKGLVSDQTGSAVDFIQTLKSLTDVFPTIWTSHYQGNKPALARLRQALKSGAHAGPSAYWDILATLIWKLPAEVLPKSYDEISDLLLAARDGVSKREERLNASSAWPAYFQLVDAVSRGKTEEEAGIILDSFVIPVFDQYVHPSEERARWTVGSAKVASILSKAAAIKGLPPLLERTWPLLADRLIEVAKISQPESSKEFEKSQKEVASAGERWGALQRELYSTELALPESTTKMFTTVNNKILEECISILEARNGKPFGAAAIIEEQLRTCSTQLLRDQNIKSSVLRFTNDNAAMMVFSPSQRPFVRCLYAIQEDSQFTEAFQAALNSVLKSDQPLLSKLKALRALFPANTPRPAIKIAHDSTELQALLASHRVGAEDEEATNLLTALLKLGAVSSETSDRVLSGLTASLSLSGVPLHNGLSSLQLITKTNEPVVRAFMSRNVGERLLPSVLRLEQSPDDAIAESASDLATKLTSTISDAPSETRYGVILQNLEKVSSSSLPLDSVIELASKIVETGTNADKFKEISPSIDIWRSAIVAAAKKAPQASLALLSPLGGALHLVVEEKSDSGTPLQYDAEGLSQAFRIASYYAALLRSTASISAVPRDMKAQITALLSICVLLSEDGTSILGTNGLWQPSSARHLDHEVMEFMSNANALLRAQTEQAGVDQAAMIAILDSLEQDCPGTPIAYYAALSVVKARDNAFETHGYTHGDTSTAEQKLKAERETKNILRMVALVAGHTQPLTNSAYLTRMGNEIVADLTSLDLKADEPKGLKKLILLNAILHNRPEILDSIAKPRLVFLVKHILPWLQNSSTLLISSEVAKALTSLLPGMADMYGEHWAQLTEALASIWVNVPCDTSGQVSEPGVLLKHGTLKLHAALRKLSSSSETNDDLVEALKEDKDSLHRALISLLQSAHGISDSTHQPLMVTNELLARQISQLPSRSFEDTEELYPLLYTPSQAIQDAAFELLHKHIPQVQEQVSFDAAIEDKKAELPDELLSLVLEAPTLDSLANASFDIIMPLSLQGYLYSWRLIFDHWTNSSYRVKNDYVEQLRESGHLNGLLELIFDFLGHNRGRPIDASTYNPASYEAGLESTPEKEVRSLLTHLYYLSLASLPSLVKNYVNNEIRSRQAPKTIEAWTAKYISPLIIDASLQEVSQWAEKVVKNDPDYEAMSVKVNMRGREIYVSYQIDEQTMAMKIVLPEAYPLQNAKPEGINRVAVSEQKWRGWLMNCQGTITFSNGSIIDALTAWRKNVAGALKGHVECAICYSIINEARELPTKRCPTCKQIFHNQCLFKWFRSSNSSTCPLCRQPYHYN